MTHPTRHTTGLLSVAEARRRISDREMVEMCLSVNLNLGSAKAGKLLDLLASARHEALQADGLANTIAEGPSTPDETPNNAV